MHIVQYHGVGFNQQVLAQYFENKLSRFSSLCPCSIPFFQCLKIVGVWAPHNRKYILRSRLSILRCMQFNKNHGSMFWCRISTSTYLRIFSLAIFPCQRRAICLNNSRRKKTEKPCLLALHRQRRYVNRRKYFS